LLILRLTTMKFFFNLILVNLFLFTQLSCKKESKPLGLEVQPEYDQLQSSILAALPVYAHTLYNDSIISFNSSLKYLGSNQDPAFGRTDVGLYLNANLDRSNVYFGGDSAILTSAEIILEASGLNYVGEASTILNYKVYPLDSSLSKTRTYYSNTTSLHSSNTLVAAFSGSYSTLDGKVVLRIPVNSNFANLILKDSLNLLDNASFQSVYKGFYISSESSQLNPVSAQGIVTLFDLSTSLSGFYLRYKRNSNAVEETFRFLFTGDQSVRYNTINYQPYQGGNYLLTKQLKGDTAIGNENAFLKGIGNTILKVNIPDLVKQNDSFYVSVNRVEVIFNIDKSFLPPLGKYEPPSILTLIPLNELGVESYGSHSYNVSNLSRYNGKYDEANNRYLFDISRFVQLIMRGDRKNYGFHLVVADPDISKVVKRDENQDRVVFYGANRLSLRPICNMYYVKLKEL